MVISFQTMEIEHSYPENKYICIYIVELQINSYVLKRWEKECMTGVVFTVDNFQIYMETLAKPVQRFS